MNKNIFIKNFPDVKVQKLTTKHVESRASVEKIVKEFIWLFNSGLLYYEYSGKKLTIYTSEIMQDFLSTLTKGAKVTDCNTGEVGTIVSDGWFIHSCYPSVTVEFGNSKELYTCEFFFKPNKVEE